MLISGLDAVYQASRHSWQDTSAPPNLLVLHLGPGEISLDLQTYVDIADQSYHRDSMTGQTADIPNLLFLFTVPNTSLLIAKETTAQDRMHTESMKGQVSDPQNFILAAGVLSVTGLNPSSVGTDPVFNKHPVQDTAIGRNPVLDIISQTNPFPSPVFEVEQNYRRDSLTGQYGRSGAIVALGVPPAF